MKKQVVTFEQLVDLAISTPESAVNFAILHKVLKLLARYCCKSDFSFEIDLDNLKGDVTVMGKRSRSSISVGGKSYGSSTDSRHSYTSDEHTQTEIKMEKGAGSDHDEKVQPKAEIDGKEHATEEKPDHESSGDTRKQSKSGSEKQKHSEGSSGKGSESVRDKKENEKEKDREKKKKRDPESPKKRDPESPKKRDESRRKSTERLAKASSDENTRKKDSRKRKDGHEETKRQSDNRANELENKIKELSERVESITQTIATHLTDEHLTVINEEIDKLKKNMETTSDQCFEVTNTINDQATQIQNILTTINDIQLRKVENEELIDLLSGKADHSFVNEKVSISQFEETVQELNEAITGGTEQLDAVRIETNASLDEIRQDLLTKLLAEEFDEAKTKIYKELIILTEKHDLILSQQNEHVASGAKMRNLNCFVCNNDVVMLLEQEIIPKFRPLKASLQPLDPIVGSRIMIGKDAPEFKTHQLKAKDFTRTSKSSRFHMDPNYERETYVKGKNGCMYKGNVGCDCVEGMNAMGRRNCCHNVEAMNLKNASLTNRMNSGAKPACNTGVGDVPNDNKRVAPQKVSTDRRENSSKIKNVVQPKTEIESTTATTSEVVPTTIPDVTEIKQEIDASIDNTTSNVPNEATEVCEGTNVVSSALIEENVTIKTEPEDQPDVSNETQDDVPQDNVDVENE